jgi:hypothetical protein
MISYRLVNPLASRLGLGGIISEVMLAWWTEPTGFYRKDPISSSRR